MPADPSSAKGRRGERRTAAANFVWLKNEAGRAGVPQRRSFERWVDAALAGRRRQAEVNVLIVNEDAGRGFNRHYRGKDYATNVLSFPYEPLPQERSRLLGDLVICSPVVQREAAEQGKALNDHYAHLTVHGVLHLLGYDHETEDEAEIMEGIERRVLAALGIADPYVKA